MTWRLIDEPLAGEGPWNMAVDEALFGAIESGSEPRPVLRLYAWSPACLSLGYHQEFEAACDPAYLKSRGFSVVRRPTGGKAVLHDDELTYAVAAPITGEFSGGLKDTYSKIAEALAASISALGIAVELKQRARAVSPGGMAPCFLVPSEKEILAGGRKIIGSAQFRGKRAFLQHGAIPLRLDYEALALATGNGAGQAARYERAFAGLADFKPAVEAAEVRKAMRAGFSATFGGDWMETGLTADEASEAERLRRCKYSRDEWNRRRMPC